MPGRVNGIVVRRWSLLPLLQMEKPDLKEGTACAVPQSHSYSGLKSLGAAWNSVRRFACNRRLPGNKPKFKDRDLHAAQRPLCRWHEDNFDFVEALDGRFCRQGKS